MSRGAFVRLLLVLGLLAGCAALALNVKPTLGFDLRGGTQILLQAEDSNGVQANAENVDKSISVLQQRIGGLGVSERTMVRVGSDRILVELPDLQDPERAERVLGQTAQLEVRPVIGPAPADQKDLKQGDIIAPSDQPGEGDLELGPTAISGTEISGADAVIPQSQANWVVNVDFTGKGGDAWAKLTGEAACARDQGNSYGARTAFVLDGKVISSPTPEPTVACNVGITGGTTSITGDYTAASARDLATLISGGALPLKISIINSRTVGPSLGEAAIDASIQAGIIGLIATGLFITVVYRLVGFLASLALTSYVLLSYAMLLAVGATLTLPGLAGFVLAIGMALDANVLTFERAREEYAANKAAGMRRALQVGFNKAFSAIIDTNVTTLLAAALLFFLASATVKGFGVTLAIGVVATLVSALVIARVLTEIGVEVGPVRRHDKVTGLANIGRVRIWLTKRNPQIIQRRATWLVVTAVTLIAAGAGMVAQGFNLGVDFTGGRLVEYSTGQPVSLERAQELVADAGYPTAQVQKTDSGNISVKLQEINDSQEQALETYLGDRVGGVQKQDDQEISASLGAETRNNAFIALGFALLAQALYLAVRFKWTFALSAVVIMFHDVFIVAGIFAWLGRPIDGNFVAAALTIIGLSVNDTVVVFDRIREKWRASRADENFVDVSNTAILETLPRTVNTGLGAIFILLALTVLGGDSLRDFSLALLLGLVIGTYSSISAATPVLTYLHQKFPMTKAVKEKKTRDPLDSGAVV